MGRRRYERLRSENNGELVDEQNNTKNPTIILGGGRRSNLVELWKKMEGKAKLGLPFGSFIATYEAMMLCFAHKFVLPQQW